MICTTPNQPAAGAANQERQKFHVLVVDDDAAFRLSMQKLLAGIGFSVHTAQDGREALFVLQQQKIDLVFSDIKMPAMTGLELLKEIKQFYPETHVVLVTAYGELTGSIEALDLMASGYLNKPVKRQEILEVIRTFYDFGLNNLRKTQLT
jgi:CheY-like chemotaxis protein